MMKKFSTVEARGDVTILLNEIRTIRLQIETNTSRYDALDEANKMYYEYKQEVRETNAKHLRNFKSIVSAVEHLGGTMFSDEKLIKIERKKDEYTGKTSQDDDHYKAVVKGKMLRVAFLKRSSCAQP